MPSAKVVTTLPGSRRLAGPGDHAALDEVDEPVGQELGVDAEVAVVAQAGEQGVRDRPDAGLDGGPVRDPLGDVGGDPLVDARSGSARWDLDEGPVDLGPARDLADVDLVAPERAGHPGVDLEEERHAGR